MRTTSEQHFDHSGGVQGATSWLLRAQNEIDDIENGRFDDEIGVVTRRNGYVKQGESFATNKPGLGFHEAKFSTGARMFVAVNNSDDTATIIKYRNNDGTWSNLTLPVTLPPNTTVQMQDSLDELYIAGISDTGVRMPIINVQKDLTASTSRSLLFSPKARFITEYGGALYAMNVEVDGVVYADRAYQSSNALSVITFTRRNQVTLSDNICYVDSARYLKKGMFIDIYDHITDTILFNNLEIMAVDKAEDTITLPERAGSVKFTTLNVNASTDVITLPSTTSYPTGTPITLSATSVLPGGVLLDNVYYVINISSTTIKLALSKQNAESGIAIDITNTGYSQTFATTAVNTTTDVITLNSNTQIVTGTPINFTTTTTLPGGLTAGVQYYAIRVTDSTFKVATSLSNANAGTAIDITSVGTGTHTIYGGEFTTHLSYEIKDNEEIYLHGRHGELYYMWNTDYPTKDKSQFLKLPSGAASNSAIKGHGKSTNRLLLFTDTTTHRWDGSQLTTIYEDIGCANHNTIVNIGDWLIWLDSETRVNARNESTGQQEFISRAIRKRYLSKVPNTNYKYAAAGKVDNIYKLSLGSVDGDFMRVCYDFDSNNWTRDTHKRMMLDHIISDMSGNRRLYFVDQNGNMFLDNEGDLDHTDTIPLRIRYGRNNSGTIDSKTYSGYYIVGKNMSGGSVRVYMDGKPDPIELGELKDNYSVITVGDKPVHGRDIDLEITHNAKGSPPSIEGYVPFLASEETTFG